MPENLRDSGIKIIGQMPWGSHICQFYRSKKDLLEILLPYFKAGLKNNELCMWITSEPLNYQEAKNALKKAVKGLDSLIEKGQIEILDYSQWYTKGGGFDANKVLAAWIRKEREALKNGFSGLRLSGNALWMEKKDWKDFTEYEANLNNALGDHRILGICTYPLDKCSASDIVDVVNNHQFALIKRDGKWVSVESSFYRMAVNDLREVNRKYQLLIDHMPIHIAAMDETGKFIVWNKYSEKLFGYKKKDTIGKLRQKDLHVSQAEDKEVIRTARGKGVFDSNVRLKRKDGSLMDIHLVVIPYKDKNSNKVNYYGFGEDITERKRIEKSLALERQRLETTIKNSPVALAITDKKGGTIFSNSEFENIWGKERPVTRNIRDYKKYRGWWADSNREVLAEEWASARVLRTGKPVTGQFIRIKRFNGSDAFIINNAAPIYDSEGRLAGSVVAILDVSEREKTKGKIDYLASFPENNPNPVMEINFSGDVLYSNPAASNIMGKSGAVSVVSHPLIPDDLEKISTGVKKGIATSLEREISIGNRTFIEHINILPQFGTARIYAMDITDRKHFEQLLEESNREIEARIKKRTQELEETNKALKMTRDNLYRAQEITHIGSWYLDIRSDTLIWSDELYRIFDLEKGTTLSYKKFLEMVYPDDREYVDNYWKAAFQNKPYDIEHRIIAGGKTKWVREKGYIEFDKEGKAIAGIGTAQDITKYKEQEKTILELGKELTYVSRVATMGEFTAALAHELNQPLMAIMSNAQAAQRFLMKGNPDLNEIGEIFSDIIKSDKHAGDIITKLRKLFKKEESEFTMINISDVIREIISLVKSDMIIKNISLDLQLDYNIPPLRGDRVQLQQAMLNLVLNSLEAMKDTDLKKLCIRANQEDDKFVRVIIEDSGTGINKKDMKNLFKPFFTTKKEGLGMGLVISKTIVESHGGSIEVENNLNGGTTLHLILPMEKDHLK